MSVAEWEGIPLAEVVARLKPSKEATGVLVSGYDHIGQNSQRSIVGASWVFPLADLDKLGAFLAIRMNGEPVPADHGKPVRLAVPGWYGCSWIKWVNEIRLVGPDEPATIADGGVRGTHAPDRAAQVRARLHARRHPDRRHAGARREAQGTQRPRISHRRHRLGRHQAGRSAADPLRQGPAVHAVLGLSGAEDAHDVVAVGIPLEARRRRASTTSRSKSPINRCRSDG